MEPRDFAGPGLLVLLWLINGFAAVYSAVVIHDEATKGNAGALLLPIGLLVAVALALLGLSHTSPRPLSVAAFLKPRLPPRVDVRGSSLYGRSPGVDHWQVLGVGRGRAPWYNHYARPSVPQPRVVEARHRRTGNA
jgi:hypothetical protein